MDKDVVIYDYMDTFFCCEVPKDKYCEEMVTEHMLCYLCSGELELISSEKMYKLKKGDAFFIRRDHMMKKVKKAGKNGEPFKGLFLQLKHPFLKRILSEHNITVPLINNQNIAKSPYILLEKHPFLTGLFSSLEGYFEVKQYPSKDLMESKLKEAVFTLLQVKPELGITLFDFAEPWKVDLRQFMENNYKCNLNLEQFAHYSARSLSTFKNDFRKTFGEITPSRWIVKRRLDEAKKIMEESGKTASEVYLEVGFKNLSHFSKAFKKEFGILPSEICK